MDTLLIIATGLCFLAAAILAPRIFKPSIKTEAEIAKEVHNKDVAAINAGKCPDCGCEGTLLQGPSGGMSMNVGCDACLMEFNIHHGFGTGAFGVDRTGRMSAGRAQVFGITPEEYASKS